MRILSFFSILFVAANSLAQNLTREKRIQMEMICLMAEHSGEPNRIFFLADKLLAIDSTSLRAIAYHGYGHLIQNDYSAALDDFNKYLARDPQSGYLILRAKAKAFLDDTSGALQDVKTALVQTGYNEKIFGVLSTFYTKLGNAVIPCLLEAIKIHPDNSDMHGALGVMYDRSGNTAFAGKEYTDAVNALNKLIFTDRSERYYMYGLKAQTDFELKNYDGAIDAITQCILLKPEKRAHYYNKRLEYYTAVHLDSKACADLAQLDELGGPYTAKVKVLECDFLKKENKPDSAWLKQLSAAGFYLKGHASQTAAEAEDNFTKAIALDPKDIYARGGRARCYLSINEKEKTIADMDTILNIDPTSAIAYHYRSVEKGSLLQLNEALKDAQKAVFYEPGNAVYLVNLAMTETNLGDTRQAMADLEKALRIDPFNARAYFEKAVLEGNLKDYPSALNDFLKAIELEESLPLAGGNAMHHYYCSKTYNDLMQYDEAVVEMDKAIALDPRNAKYYFVSGEIKARMKDLKGACADWTIAKKLGYKESDEVLLYNCNPSEK